MSQDTEFFEAAEEFAEEYAPEVVEHGQHLVDEGPEALDWVVENSKKEFDAEQAGHHAILYPVDTYHEHFESATPDPAPTLDMAPSPEQPEMHVEGTAQEDVPPAE